MKFVKKQNKYGQLLAQSFLFNGIEQDLAQDAFQSSECSCMEYEAGEKIYTRSNYRKSLGIVFSGVVKAMKPENENLVMNTFYSGGIFGVACLFNNSRRYVSEITAVKRSRVLFLSQQLLQDLFEKNTKIAENYISYLSDRICFLNSRIDNFTGGTAVCRLATFLLSLSAQHEYSLVLELPCTLTQLSNTLNIGRASLYRAFDDLSSAGVVTREGKKVTINQIERLRTGQFDGE
ncbi:Crp/Fnr family transcriptional regulator [Caproiciproducens faecalis]|uniref:Crp/Fnr family transcriptional regulator n=1 Tax=Caproiciproducens faecalis TaxID=2820301 RepID=A0ABS7DRK9_9FIRM|nr:Crp/Fnr family transcriptional regulator [Caproiciproducens faecalis]MBW7573943.1 Crp/Fnr family transcriptional regulator [Caproiciproducens faecalis]